MSLNSIKINTNDTNYTHSIFDISEYTRRQYEDLSSALADVPTEKQSGGMTIRYIQTSDNNYVRYNLLADSFTTDTIQWAIDDAGVYVDNPEFVEVKLDAEDKILWAIKIDGGIYYGAGVPQQVIDYINERIAELSLDEYEDIVAFLNGLEEGDKTLQTLLNEKVDKEEGKSLINAEYASSQSAIENPEFLEVTTDSEDKVLEGIQQDGTKVIGGDLSVGGSAKILGEMEVSGVSYKVIENAEYLAAWVDAEDKVIFGIKTDGKTYVGDTDFLNDIENIKDFLANITDKNIDWDALSSITAVENPEFIEAKTDSEGKLLAGRTPDGAAFENVGFSAPKVSIDGHTIKNIEDPEGRSEITTDSEGKIISYRDADGVKHEVVGIKTGALIPNSLKLPLDAIGQVEQVIEDYRSPELKVYDLPKYGIVNIVSETFYLTANAGYEDKDGVYPIQVYPNTQENAQRQLTCQVYYVKSSLVDNGDGTYSLYNDGVEGHDIALDFYAASEISKVNENYYVSSSLVDGQVVPESIEVTQIVDVPNFQAWSVDKKKEHYCIADIDFGRYLKGATLYIGIKFQGTSTLRNVKRNFRFTFYKNGTYTNKDKIKIGEMVKLSGYNLKANYSNTVRVKEHLLNQLFMAIWEERNYNEQYPWNNAHPFSGATGMIKGFPVRVNCNNNFYGLYVFGLKKDEKNYLLNGDKSGMIVSGEGSSWETLEIDKWEDEMNDEMTQSNIDALQSLWDFINGNQFDKQHIPEHMSVKDWIDYFICLQVFYMQDNTSRNMMLYAGSDKVKFYPFFYDLDLSWRFDDNTITNDIIEDNTWATDMSIWRKIRNVYWIEIVERYKYLRTNVLSIYYIGSLYNDIMSNIPTEDLRQDLNWGGIVSNFKVMIQQLKVRFHWLDNEYFI